ncbi:MAG: hypothetical protein ACHQC8_02625 [Solirubrobacterales bacterium]
MNDLRTPRGQKDYAPPAPTPIAPTDPRLIVFLEALPTAADEEFCSPPGIGGLWRVKHVRSGLARGVLVVHHRGTHIAFAPFPPNHRKHPCSCVNCYWEREADEHGGNAVTRQQAQRMRVEILSFQFGQVRPRIEAFDAPV